jgi:uncharacterized repeat protein (TIGR03803 family)
VRTRCETRILIVTRDKRKEKVQALVVAVRATGLFFYRTALSDNYRCSKRKQMNIITRCIPGLVAVALAGTVSTACAQYTLTTLTSFNGANGSQPRGDLAIDASGNLYGTTYAGGATGVGTVFEIGAGSHSLTTLTTFNGDNGANPIAGLTIDPTGHIYGTTQAGGAVKIDTGYGTVFEIAAATHTLTTLYSFDFGPNGASPDGALVSDANGNLYGTASRGGGVNGNGAVFKVAAGSHAVTTLHSFGASLRTPNSPDTPEGRLVIDASGNLYGTTVSGGTGSSGGTVFKVAANTNAISTLASFSNEGSSLIHPGSLAIDASGNLYGTLDGPIGRGAVFEVANDVNHTFSILAAFNGVNGANPSVIASLVLDASGNIYGTTNQGGDLTLNSGRGFGTVFKVANDANHTLTTLAIFKGTNGASPDGGLLLDAKGNLYGTTQSGGPNGQGTVFMLSPVPEPSTLALAGCGITAALGWSGGRWGKRRKVERRPNQNNTNE